MGLTDFFVLLGLVHSSLLIEKAIADVGIFSSDGNSVRTTSTLHRQSWTMSPDGCRVGKAGNLVVTPLGGSAADGREILDTQRTGPQLCAWLSMMEKAHYEMSSAWESRHNRKRSQVSRWNILRRFLLWTRSFPELEFQVEVRYISLWNKDRFGHPMPWASVVFRYICPESDRSYGLLDHLCGAVFSQGKDPRVGTEVYLLLQPRTGYNRPLDVRASNWQYVSGALSGLRGARTESQREADEKWMWLSSTYSRLNSIMTISGKVDDCWMNGGECYFKWLLRVEWRLFSETVCERLHRDANAGFGGALKAAALQSVQVNITGMDLFNFSSPLLYGVLDEGILQLNAGSGFVTLEVDTNPFNPPNFERAKSTSQNVRAASMLFKGVRSFFGARSKEDS